MYGESLFLLLAVATFVLAERGRLGWAAVVSGLALLTRAQGIALLPALAVFAWRSDRRARNLALLLVPIAMFLVFPLVLELWIGHGLAFVDAQKLWERSLAPLGPLGGLVQAIGEGDVVGPVLAVAMVALAVLSWRVLGAPYGLYALAALAIPMALPSERLGGLYSFPRFALVAFPCLVALAVLGRDRRVHVATVAVLAAGSGGRRGSMGAVVLGRLTEVPAPPPRRLGDSRGCARRALVRGQPLERQAAGRRALPVVDGGGRARAVRDHPRDRARPRSRDRAGDARAAPAGLVGRAAGWILAALAAIWVLGAILNIFLKAGEEQGLVPDGVGLDPGGPVRRELRRRRDRRAVRRGADLPRPRVRGRARGSCRADPAILSRRSPSGSPTGSSSGCRCSRSSARSSRGCAVKTGSVYPAMIVHGVFNGLALIVAVST